MKIITIKGKIKELDYFVDCIISAFQNMQLEYYVIDVNALEKTAGITLNQFVQSGDCVFFTFNNIGALLMEGNENFWEKYDVKVYSFLVDHPRNYGDLLNQPIDNLHIICQDRYHEKFVRRYYTKVENIFFLPNGGMQEEKPKDFQKRKLDVVYFGDCQEKVTAFPKLLFFADGGAEFFANCIQMMLQNSWLTTEEAIEINIKKFFPNAVDQALREVNETIAIYIEFVVRRYYKQKMLRAFNEAGICVEIYGNHWEDDEYTFGPNVSIHSRISPEECNRFMGDAKITLNFLPWQKNGCSERPYNSMLNGSVCLIDDSPLLKETYVDKEDIIYFDMNEPEKTVEYIKELLEEPEQKTLEHIATSGYKKAVENDTWKHRAYRLLDIFAEK